MQYRICVVAAALLAAIAGCKPDPTTEIYNQQVRQIQEEWRQIGEAQRQADAHRTLVTTAELPNQDAVVGGLAYRMAGKWDDDGLRVTLLIVNQGDVPATVPLSVVRDPAGRVYEPSGDPHTLRLLGAQFSGFERLNPQQAIYGESFFPMPPTAGCQVIVVGPVDASATFKVPNPVINGVEMKPVPSTQRSSS